MLQCPGPQPPRCLERAEALAYLLLYNMGDF